MQENKLLTVSVAAYNAEQYLREVLDSFVNLERINEIEVFVIDDGGTDSTLDIAYEYANKYPSVFIPVHKENGGWGSTVNYSIKHAKGKYFKLLDGDDYYDQDNLKLFLDYLDTIETDVIVSPYFTFKDGSENELEKSGIFDSSYQEGVIYSLNDVDRPFSLAMHAITVRTELLSNDSVSLKERCLYRDMEFTANVLLRANHFCFFKNPVYCYRLGRDGQSVGMSSYIKHMDEHADVVYDILKLSKETNDPKRRELLYNLVRGAYAQQYRIYFFPSPKKEFKTKLRTFEQTIRKSFPEFYSNTELPFPYNIFQKIHFRFYYLLSIVFMIKRRNAKSN